MTVPVPELPTDLSIQQWPPLYSNCQFSSIDIPCGWAMCVCQSVIKDAFIQEHESYKYIEYKIKTVSFWELFVTAK